jgi:hypothetical protein
MTSRELIGTISDPRALEAAAEFLEYDLRDTAENEREGSAAAELCERLVDDVAELDPTLLAQYATARRVEREELRCGGPDTIHCSMTMEIGFLLDPKTIEDVCWIYIRAVEAVRADPRWKNPDADMYRFWIEFTTAGHA